MALRIDASSIRRAIVSELDLLPLRKTTNAAHMLDNAAVDFLISDAGMETLKGARGTDYGEARALPVFRKKRRVDTMGWEGWAHNPT